MLEPFMCHRADGRVVNDLSAQAVIRSVAIASGLGATSGYSWLKLPVATVLGLATNARRSGWLILGSSGGLAPGLYYAARLDATIIE